MPVVRRLLSTMLSTLRRYKPGNATDTGTFTANADVETHVLKASGGTTITLSAAGQNVTTGADGADTINVAGLTATGTLNTVTAISSRLMMVAALRVDRDWWLCGWCA